jgi:hypothetical protein
MTIDRNVEKVWRVADPSAPIAKANANCFRLLSHRPSVRFIAFASIGAGVLAFE